jgi:hypothetical protein
MTLMYEHDVREKQNTWQLDVDTILQRKYAGLSESNASYFIMLAHAVRGGCL